MLSCGRKTACACTRDCQCKNAGLKWINMCSGCGWRTCNNSDLNDDVVWAQPFPVLHAQNVLALLDFNSFPEPHIHIRSFTPLPWGGVHHHNITVYICWNVMIVTVIAWQGPEALDSGMGFRAIDMANWNMYISSQCILLPSDWRSDSHWYPAWPCGASNQINWLVCNDHGSTNLALNDLHSFNMTESYRYNTILHCITKPCRDHCVLAQAIRACVVLQCRLWLAVGIHRIIHALGW